jgi:hypothetical protein
MHPFFREYIYLSVTILTKRKNTLTNKLASVDEQNCGWACAIASVRCFTVLVVSIPEFAGALLEVAVCKDFLWS